MNKPLFVHGLHRISTISQVWPQGCALTIGSFDGVHLGHQVVLNGLIAKANSMGLPSVVMIFEPQPHEFFSRESAPARLTRLREKAERLFSRGIDAVVCLKFNTSLRLLTANQYIQQVLLDSLSVKYLVVGDDFRFGCDRSGDFNLLKQAGDASGFSVDDTSTQTESGERISSTRIRALLEQNSFAEAQRLLGEEYSITGRVIYGKQLGRTIGFRTANIGLGRYRSPVHGVFVVDISVAGSCYRAVANVGVRPTVSGGEKPLLEVHILDFDGDIYRQRVCVTFLHKIRDEMKFASLDELKAQIAVDIENAKSYLAHTN